MTRASLLKRRIIEELRPSLLDNLGLGSAIEWLAHQMCDRAGIEPHINVPVDAPKLPPQIAIALFRIVQEALTNVVKYAKAKKVEIDLMQSPEHVSLVISDDGIGIPEGRAEQPPVARHQRHAPTRARAARRVLDPRHARPRDDDRGDVAVAEGRRSPPPADDRNAAGRADSEPTTVGGRMPTPEAPRRQLRAAPRLARERRKKSRPASRLRGSRLRATLTLACSRAIS